MHSISVLRLALVLAYDAAFTLPALTANSLVLAYLAASTLPALTALSLVLTSRFWIEKARRKRQKKCAFLVAKSYGPGLKHRLH